MKLQVLGIDLGKRVFHWGAGFNWQGADPQEMFSHAAASPYREFWTRLASLEMTHYRER
jgi:hypothetical protein